MGEYGETATNKPLISVIIPCYNQARYLPDAVDSVISQTVGNWECLVINDGSPDDTERIVSQLMQSDKRIRYVKHENAGPSYTRNRGIELATGRYIQFLDADDMLAPTKLESQLGLLESTKEIALAYCDYHYATEDGAPILDHPCYKPPLLEAGYALQDLAHGWETKLSIPIHCFLFDARIFKECGIRFDESLPNNEDWDCWMNVLALNPRLFYVDDKYAIYRLHADARTSDNALMRKGFLKAIRKQRRLLSGDKEMCDILDKKASAIRFLYRDHAPVRRAWLRLTAVPRAFVRNHLPPSMKEFLRKAFGR